MEEWLSTMSLERIIAHLTGPHEGGEAEALSPAQRRAISQRLRAMVDVEHAEGSAGRVEAGRAGDALTLAAYLDGSMTGPERDAFEAELVQSPARRDELIAAVAWIEDIATKQEAPPPDVTALAIALEAPAASARAGRAPGFTGLIEWLLPRPRLAIATSALASIAIVAVGIDIALHTSPQLRQVIQSQSAPPVGSGSPNDGWRGSSAREPASPPERPFLPVNPDAPIVLTAETINALIAYRGDPSPTRKQELLASLARAGAAPFSADRVRAIIVEPTLYERLMQPRDGLPTRIATRLSLDGELTIAIAN
jgi:hypothetical protein